MDMVYTLMQTEQKNSNNLKIANHNTAHKCGNKYSFSNI